MTHAVVAAAALLLEGPACDDNDYTLGSEDPPPALATVACKALPTVLTRIPGLSARLMQVYRTNLYVVSSAGGDANHETLWRVPVTGEPPQIVADQQDPIGGIDVGPSDSGQAAIVWSSGSQGTDGTIWRNDASGTTAIASHRAAPGALIVDGKRVYWAEGPSGDPPIGTIDWVPISGGDVAEMATLPTAEIPRTFDADEANLYWTTEDAALGNEATAQILRVRLLPFGAVQQIARGVGGIELIGRTVVYSGPNALARVDDDGGTLTTVETIPTSGFVQTIEESGWCVYYVDPAARELREADIFGEAGTSIRLAQDVDPGTALQADDSCVYWVDAPSQAVMMVRQ